MAGFTILSVSQIGTYLKSVLDSDKRLLGIYIKGEIADLRDHYSSGHIYFTLKDGAASLRAVMFQSYAARMRFRLSDGMAVIVRGDISFYPKDGSCQLYAYDAQPDGIGAKYVALEQLKEKLLAEGLFDEGHKKPLSRYPKCIGVVTSASGAALQDILRVLKRRWPVAEVLVTPALVQGESAARDVVKAVKRQNACGRADVIIVGRGGGSNEDLFAFNDETLVRAVYNSAIPIVSAVGHETDYTLCDLAADMRAPTPSAAAEMVSPDMAAITGYVEGASQLMLTDMRKQLDRGRKELSAAREELRRAEALYMRQRHEKLAGAMERLESRSPLGILRRGYAVAEVAERPLVSIKQLNLGDTVGVRLFDGSFSANVTNIEEGAAH